MKIPPSTPTPSDGRVFLPDTSVVLNQGILALLNDGKLGRTPKLILSRTCIKEIQRMADAKKEAGIIGLAILEELRKREGLGDLIIEVVGTRPSLERVELNARDGGEMDAIIMGDALDCGATLVTSDRVQSQVARVEGLDVLFYEAPHEPEERSSTEDYLQVESYFDETTLSVHLKEDAVPFAKKGKPGAWVLEDLDDSPLSVGHLREIASEIIGRAKDDPKSFIEISTEGITVVQLRDYRIVITRPPFASGFEITAVHPLVSLSIEDYEPSARLLKKLDKAEGILVCGSPGAGKSTFVAALAKYYVEKNKIVKTLESIRDLQVPPEITQYQLYGRHAVDVLLLVRPDYTLFDEVRNGTDFKKYADLRLAGVGMVGVVHSSSAIDAVQRFVPHLELGMIPSIIDTIIYINDGAIDTVYGISLTVRVPKGLQDRDLARPVIEVSNYETREVEFELYTFGDHVVVSPLRKIRRRGSGSRSGARWSRGADRDLLPGNVRPGQIPMDVRVTKKAIILSTLAKFGNQVIDVGVDGETLFNGALSQKGQIRLGRNSKLGRQILRALKQGRRVWGEI
ncbi:MAG: hypothetical protein ACTSU5_06960 [Promethearchaeota archaeon]